MPEPLPCTILLFAGVAESAGVRQIAATFTPGAPAGVAWELLAKHSPAAAAAAAQWRSGAVLAVNERLVPASTPLAAGDVVAIMPPASGG
ncbi:MAG TPA: MoaD/ThiS family protein [Phycisphaerales bacterium]|nr:MoaD/ThiS family protein [Phycisphaerales bacterium]HMP38121.1 MoaD/ThiS family protein [Phycisphaerales bacterium]